MSKSQMKRTATLKKRKFLAARIIERFLAPAITEILDITKVSGWQKVEFYCKRENGQDFLCALSVSKCLETPKDADK